MFKYSLVVFLADSEFNEVEYLNTTQTEYLKRHFVVTAGTHFSIAHRVLMMTYINTILVSNIRPSFELSGIFIFDKKYWLGPNYRFDESIGIIVGIIIAKGYFESKNDI